MKKLNAVILFILLMFLAACEPVVEQGSGSPPDLVLEAPALRNIGEIDKGLQLDESGNFSYVTFKAGKEISPYFNINDEFPGNVFIYETRTPHIDDSKLYGYMDNGFKALTDPISLSPNVFVNGFAMIDSAEDSFVMNLGPDRAIEICPGYVLIENSLIRVDWKDKVPNHFTILNGLNLDSYLIPVKYPDNAEHGKWGYISANDFLSADEIDESLFSIPHIFDEARPFYNGLAAVKKDDLWGYISEDGDIVIEFKYQQVRDFIEDSTFVFKGDMLTQYFSDINNENVYLGSWTLIDGRGTALTNFVSPYAITNVDDFHEGFAIIEYGKMGNSSRNHNYINIEGDMLLEGVDGMRVKAFNKGIAIVGWGDYRFINTNGENLFTNVFRRARDFSDGVAAVRMDRGMYSYTFIDKSGNIIFDRKFMTVCDFNNGYAFVVNRLNEPGYVIDKLGNEYLKELNIHSMSKFNDEGYAIAFTVIDVNESTQDKLYYIIRIETLPD